MVTHNSKSELPLASESIKRISMKRTMTILTFSMKLLMHLSFQAKIGSQSSSLDLLDASKFLVPDMVASIDSQIDG